MYRRRRRFLQRPAPGVRPAPRAASSITGLLERISVIAHISSQQEYKEREREQREFEIQTSLLQRSFFNASEFFKIALHESPLPVLLETVSVKSVVLCERFFARVSSASRVVKIKASSFLSSPKNSEKNNKKCAVERARRWLFLLFFGLCFLLFS